MVMHERKARACSDEHERKIRGRAGAVTQGRNRAMRRLLTQAQLLLRHKRRWRNVAMGVEEETNLGEIFGEQLGVFAALGTRGPVLSDDD